MTSEEFINSLVDYRMQAVSAQRELSTTDYEAVSDDGIFVKSLRDSYPEITDEEIADELFKAKDLSSYATTTEAMRQLYMTQRKTTTTRRKTIKYSASSWKHKGMRLLRL
jgi:hypothetical protein